MSQQPAIKVSIVPVTPFQQNASIIVCAATGRAAIVDPGGDLPLLEKALADLGARPEKILLTHGHIDHAGGAAELSERLSLPIEGPHAADAFLLSGLAMQAKMFGMEGVRAVTTAKFLAEGGTVSIGEAVFDILHVPGHSPGSLVYAHKPSRFALVGDTVFQGSVGRTDFPYGDHDLLIRGVKTKLFPLGDAVTILPGHGPPTTIGAERANNPFLQ